jgi:hypothetical protein
MASAASEMAIFRTRGGTRQLCGCGRRCRVIAIGRREADHAWSNASARAKDENAKLKKLLAEAMLDNAMLKDVASKKW